MKFTSLAAAASTCILAMTSMAAHAVIVDIDATSSTGTTVTFAAGEYTIEVVGQAGGGLYDGWTYNGSSSVRDAFTLSTDSATISYDTDNGTTKFSNYASTADALAAFATGPYTIYNGSTDGTAIVSGYAYMPIGFFETTTVTFSVPDYKFDDNTGGVSLSIAAAVPEPETYALMLAGLGVVGSVARRRKAA